MYREDSKTSNIGRKGRSRLTRWLAMVATVVSMMVVVVPVSPAEAQPGSRVCGYMFSFPRFVKTSTPGVRRVVTRSTAYVIEIPKGSSQVQKDICTAAQKHIRDAQILPNGGKDRISIRRMECEDLALKVGYPDSDPCLRMQRASNLIQARNRSITQVGTWGMRHYNGNQGWIR